jgi:copper chaperone CopZ
VIALVTGVVGGAAVLLLGRRETGPAAEGRAATAADGPASPFEAMSGADKSCTDCAKPTSGGGGPAGGSGNVVVRALRYGLVTLPRDIGTTLIVGVAIAGLLGALIEPGSLNLEPGIGSILLMMAAAVPLYVCATASVPIAVGLIHVGVSPGAALAFLIAGPATNAATVTTLWRLVGRRVTLIYLATVGLSAVVGGLVLDALLPAAWAPPAAGEHLGHETGGLAGHVWAVALLAVLLLSYLRIPARRRRGPETPSETGETMDESPREVRMKISGMTCSHCADTVRRTLGERPDVSRAEVDLDAGTAVVVGENGFDADGCVTAVRQLGYGAELAVGP